jgi:uncharacterized protein (DUF488 family)
VPLTVHTIGHSTRSADEFVALLSAHGVGMLADIRTVPKSRRVPHFNIDALPRVLEASGIGYQHMKDLGGLRKPKGDSPNSGWRNDSFRGYADYMQTPEFARALDELVAVAAAQPTAIMCAEAVPWRCHRSMVADALAVLKGARVLHIMSPTAANEHKPTKFLVRTADGLLYPAQDLLSPDAP